VSGVAGKAVSESRLVFRIEYELYRVLSSWVEKRMTKPWFSSGSRPASCSAERM